MAAQTGILWINGRDLATDFSFAATATAGWPGNLSAAKRTAPVLSGPEMQGGIYDPRLIARQAAQASLSGIIMGSSLADALTKSDALRGLVMQVEVTLRTGYATDRYCLALCTDYAGVPFNPGVLDGVVSVAMTFTVKDGLAWRTVPDGVSLSTARATCPIGTAESYPVITIHGGGATVSNPVVTLRNAGGDVVQTHSFTISGGADDALIIDSARSRITKSAAGTLTDGWTYCTPGSGDFVLLRPADGNPELAAYPTVELSSATGTMVGSIAYSRRFA